MEIFSTKIKKIFISSLVGDLYNNSLFPKKKNINSLIQFLLSKLVAYNISSLILFLPKLVAEVDAYNNICDLIRHADVRMAMHQCQNGC